MEDLIRFTKRKLLITAIEAAVLDIKPAKDLISNNDYYSQKEFFGAIVPAYDNLNIFPLVGTIAKSGDYGYLKIKNGDIYIESTLRLLNLWNYSNPLNNKYPGSEFIPPPSPAGAHVTLRGVKQKDIGQKINFTLDTDRGLVSYLDEGKGTRRSGLDPTVFPIQWYVIYVKGIPDEFVNPYDSPHVTVAMLAYVV